MYKTAPILYKTNQNFELTFWKIKKRIDNLMKFSEKFNSGDNKKIPKKCLVNFV